MLQQIKNFTGAISEHVTSGLKNVSSEEQARRLAICGECPFFDSDRVVCKICGCRLAIKTKWATSKCPKGYW